MRERSKVLRSPSVHHHEMEFKVGRVPSQRFQPPGVLLLCLLTVAKYFEQPPYQISSTSYPVSRNSGLRPVVSPHSYFNVDPWMTL